MRVRLFWPAAALVVLAVLAALAPGLVRAAPPAPQLRLAMPGQAALGDTITVRATLTDTAGAPIPSATVTFLSPVVWSSDIKGEAELGTATTDASGVALFSYQMRRAGDVSIIARYAGAPGVDAASSEAAITVVGDTQLYLPSAGIRVAALGPWIIALVIGAVWGLYFLVALRVLAISRARTPALEAVVPSSAPGRATVDRRQFLTQTVVPLGMLAAIAAVGSGLVTMVLRSPYTHWNLSRDPAGRGYRRTPFVKVGAPADMMAMPAVLPRDVSFSRDVLPLLLSRAGPHAYPPKHSPAPGGVQLDTYEHIMAKEGLVVPGNPEQSRLMGVLLDRSMGMPPAGELFSMDEIQVISSWIAQGAKDT